MPRFRFLLPRLLRKRDLFWKKIRLQWKTLYMLYLQVFETIRTHGYSVVCQATFIYISIVKRARSLYGMRAIEAINSSDGKVLLFRHTMILPNVA